MKRITGRRPAQIALETAGGKQEILETCIRRLCRCTADIAPGYRERVFSYRLAAEGIGLFNRIGLWCLNTFAGPEKAEDGDGEDGRKAEGSALAKELENWYDRYQKLWREVSLESELYRIREVICWYADCLRGAHICADSEAALQNS